VHLVTGMAVAWPFGWLWFQLNESLIESGISMRWLPCGGGAPLYHTLSPSECRSCGVGPAEFTFARPAYLAPVSSRQKLVAFRVRVEEYEALKRAVSGEGSCSVSEFARKAILHRISALREIRPRLEAVAQELQDLSDEVKALSVDAVNLPASKGTRKRRPR
jgi:hypothetical protein